MKKRSEKETGQYFELGQRLREIADHCGGVSQLIDALGVSKTTIYEYLRGEYKMSKTKGLRLEAKLGLSYYWYLTGKGEMTLADGANSEWYTEKREGGTKGERLRAIVDYFGGVTSFSRRMGVSKNTIYNYINNDIVMSTDRGELMEDIFGASYDWYLTGVGRMIMYPGKPELQEVESTTPNSPDLTLSVFAASAAPEGGVQIEDQSITNRSITPLTLFDQQSLLVELTSDVPQFDLKAKDVLVFSDKGLDINCEENKLCLYRENNQHKIDMFNLKTGKQVSSGSNSSKQSTSPKPELLAALDFYIRKPKY